MEQIIQLEKLSKSEKMKYSTKEVAKFIRQHLKQLKGCKFSVTKESYSGGSTICIALIEADFQIFKRFDELNDKDKWDLGLKDYRTEEELKNWIDGQIRDGYAQVNQYYLHENKYLTKKAIEVLTQARNLSLHFNWDNSDSMTDYFDVHFYLDLHIGKWNKAVKEVC